MSEIFNLNNYPSKKWPDIEKIIKKIGENESLDNVPADIDFLNSIGLIVIDKDLMQNKNRFRLSDLGKQYFEDIFIRLNEEGGKKKLQSKLLEHPPVIAIQQYLNGVKNVTIDQVITVLKSVNLWNEDIKIVHFLDLLNHFGIIKYNRKYKFIKIIIPPDTENIPPSIYIDPQRPYSNIMWIKKIISQCEGYLFWLDKHFQKEAFEWLYSSADGNQLKKIRILSIELNQNGKNAKKEYRRLKTELDNKGISLEWRLIEYDKIKDSHDRWIICSNCAWNIPNVNAISSGQSSELNLSQNKIEIEKRFLEYWSNANPII